MKNRSITLGIFATTFLLMINKVLERCTVNGREVPCDEFWASYG